MSTDQRPEHLRPPAARWPWTSGYAGQPGRRLQDALSRADFSGSRRSTFTRTSPSIDDFKLLAQARAIYQEQADEIDPNLAFLISNRWDTGAGEFGALFNASYVKTTWLNQGVHAGASVPFRTLDDPAGSLFRLFPNDPGTRWTPGLDSGLPTAPGSTLDIDPVPFLHARDAVFQPHVTGERERPAWNVSLQWAPNDTSEYMFEVFYNGYENTQHNSLFFTFVDWWGSVNRRPVEIRKTPT
jgi:hypothetical protein